MHKQMRMSFSGTGEEETERSSSSNRDRRIPPPEAQTSKGETRRSVSWLERQFTKKTIRDNNDVDYQIAVAAAAFAVKSIEDKSSNNRDQRKIKSKKAADDTTTTKRSEKSSNIAAKTSKTNSKVQERPAITVNQDPINSLPSLKKSTVTSADTKKKNSTFTDKNIDITTPKMPQISSVPTTGISGNSKADIWEQDEMKKIKQRYEKLNKVILDWETKKKKKAARHLKEIEAELDRRRAKARENFHGDIGRIQRIGGGARAQAEKNQENEELKVKEKANKIKSTGKIPPSCLCY